MAFVKSPFTNKVHHGFGFIADGNKENTNSLSSWVPKPLAELSKEATLPIFSVPHWKPYRIGDYLMHKCDLNIPVGPSQTETTFKCSHDLIRLVQKWVENEMLRDKSRQIIPIICSDKSVRYARTGEQYFKSKRGYAIQVKIIKDKMTDDGSARYYMWSVVDDSIVTSNEGMVFEYYVFKDFYEKQQKLEKNFHFFSLTSFDCIKAGVIYRFYCIGEIDGVQSTQDGNYIPLEVKSSSATEDNFNSHKLFQYYAKCAVSQVPKLVIGMRTEKLTPTSNGFKANYQEIREYQFAGCPKQVLSNQETNLAKAITIFHENIKMIGEKQPMFLNGYLWKFGIDVYFKDRPRRNQ